MTAVTEHGIGSGRTACERGRGDVTAHRDGWSGGGVVVDGVTRRRSFGNVNWGVGVGIDVADHLAGCKEPGTGAEGSLGVCVDGLGGVGLLADGLYEAYAAVWLEGCLGEVFPSFHDDGVEALTVEISVVDTPEHTVGEEGRAGGFGTWRIVFAEHTAAPISVGALDTGHALSQLTEALHEDGAVLIVVRHVGQDFGETCKDPSVAACPETLATVAGGLDLRVDIFGIAVVELFFLVVHQAVGPEEVVVELVEILDLAGELVHLRHDGHDHIEGVGPPPEVGVGHAALVAHDLDGTCYFVGSRHEVIHIYIGLEADLPVAEEDEVLTFAVGLVLPVGTVVRLCAFPLVVAAPFVGVGVPVGTACEAVGFHIAGVVGGVVPE